MRNHAGRKRFFIPVFALMALFAVTFAVYWLWNNVLVAVVAVKSVTYWQAMGLLVLSRILLGSFKFNSPANRPLMDNRSDHWREKWRKMSDEERAAIKNKWRRWGQGN